MIKELVTLRGTEVALYHFDSTVENGVHLIWGHGWGQSSEDLRPVAECFIRSASCTLIDFPGFGASPAPPQAWGTEDYADALAEWVRSIPCEHRVWIGHSFGCRIGMQVAARHPGLLSALVLVAAPGLPSKSYARRIRRWLSVSLFKALKSVIPHERYRERLRQRFGSVDYKDAGEMRAILSKVVSENLADVARCVNCPVLFIFGEDDVDTLPSNGERYTKIIGGSQLVILKGFDHHSIVRAGRHQVAFQVQKFLDSLS